MASETIAYCWATGVIEFGTTVPDGAIEISRGKDRLVRNMVAGTARVAHDNKTLLVPGIPEAPNQHAAGDALAAHLRWLKKRECKGFKVALNERMRRFSAVALLALTLLASAMPTWADTLDVYASAAKWPVRFEGTVLALDQVGAAAIVGFSATTEVRPAPKRPKWPAAAGSWAVIVSSNDGIEPREWTNCRPLTLTYLESSGMHLAVECDR
jgi:hypothetical protein